MTALARSIARRRRLVIVGAFLIVMIAGAYGGPVAGILDNADDFDDPASESVRARVALEQATGASPAPDLVALVRDRSREREVITILRRDPDVATVAVPRRGTPLVSRDGSSSYVPAAFKAGRSGETADRLADELGAVPGVIVGGPRLAYEQVGQQVSEDLARAELLAFPILFALSLLVFRGAVAALLPLAVGGASIMLAFAMLRGVNEVEGMSIFALNMITGLGLGLAIDYSLFMISRFREELENHAETAAALAATMRTAGRTVLFSSLTVAAALASVIVFPQRFLFSMGIGGALVSLAAALVSLTLLPALLAVLGPRVNALSPRRWRQALQRDARQVRAGFWYRWSQVVMRRPGPVAAIAATVLIVAGLPFARIEFTGVDAGILPPERSAKVVDQAIKAEFPTDTSSPLTLAVRAADAGEVRRLAERLGALPGAAHVGEPVRGRDGLYRLDVIPRGPALGDDAKALVAAVRAQERGRSPSFHAQERGRSPSFQVGGQTAEFIDQQASLGAHLPIALGILAVTTLVILFVMTGSVVLPIKTLVMNVLTLSAAFGILVLVFQDGRLEGLLDFSSTGALDSTQPILLFAMAFGLSTDYGVFLLTRIKEARDAGLDDREAVAVGLERTGRIVTFAALLFCIAIGAFATSEIVFIKQVGVGTALAVLIDATIVRALLVPSLMRLLGRWNWWAPRGLQRFHVQEAHA